MPTEPAVLSRCRPAVVVGCLAVAAACEATPAARAPTSAPIEVPATDLHVIGSDESIAVVQDLAVLPGGDVWVQNSVEPFFVGFTGDVGVIGHGRAGGGPDEFGAPAGFVVGGLDEEVWVFDRRRHALVRISTFGERGADVPLPRDAIPFGSVMPGMSLMGSTVRTARLGDEVMLPRRLEAGEVEATSFWTTIWHADLIAFNPQSGSVRTVISLPEVMGNLTFHFEELSRGFPPFPLWYRLWAVCSGDVVRFYDFNRDELRGFTAEGRELDPIPVPPPFTEVTARQFARAAFDLAVAERAGAVHPGIAEMSPADSMQILNSVVARLEGTPRQLGQLLPKYVDFRCAEDGTMWLRPLDLERGGMQGGPAWLRIAPDGRTHEVRFPERFDPYRFTSDRVWGVLRDDFDVASVVWTEMPQGS